LPLKDPAPARQLQLLDDPADDLALLRPADARQVGRVRLVGGDERRAVRREDHLVQVGRPPRRGVGAGDLPSPLAGGDERAPSRRPCLVAPSHEVSTGLPLKTATRRFVTALLPVRWNQTGSPSLSMISAPCCSGAWNGPRNSSPWATGPFRVTETTGGRRSGRETYECTECSGGGFAALHASVSLEP